MGLGLLGRGIGDSEYLAQSGAELIITDLKKEEELKDSLARLEKFENITYVLGEHRREDFKDRDMILKAAGVQLHSPYIEEARENSIPIEMSASLLVQLLPKKVVVVGITGTRGKSTVTHLIHHILQSAGKTVYLGGNVRGVSTLALLDKVVEGDVVILELDSWQLQGFGERKISPRIAVFTNFLPDHMNYYPDMQRYFEDKANIFNYQKTGDILITTPQSSNTIERYGGVKPSNEIVVKAVETNNPTLLGEHNAWNAGCSTEVARQLGIQDADIEKAVDTFAGVEGRLQYLKEIEEVKIYNDNNATTPDATLAGLRALGDPPTGEKNIILIMGGSDKGLDMSELVEEIPNYCKAVILLSGTGTDKLRFKIQDSRFKKVETLKEAVAVARVEASRGDIVLFSPAFASFGQFKNEFDRGDQFVEIISDL